MMSNTSAVRAKIKARMSVNPVTIRRYLATLENVGFSRMKPGMNSKDTTFLYPPENARVWTNEDATAHTATAA